MLAPSIALLGSFAYAADPVIVMGEVRVSAQRDAGVLRSSTTDQLRIVPGYRLDRFTGSNPLADGGSAGLQDYGWIKQPKYP